MLREHHTGSSKGPVGAQKPKGQATPDVGELSRSHELFGDRDELASQGAVGRSTVI